MHKVNRPLLIGRGCRYRWWAGAHQTFAFLTLDAEPGGSVDPEDAFMVHNLSFTPQQDFQSSVPVTWLLLR